MRKKYDIGYGKPPKDTRFPKGKSGNAKGRPKGSLSFLSIFRKVAFKSVGMMVDGKRVQVPLLEAASLQAGNKAATGDLKAYREFMRYAHLLVEEEITTGQGPTELERSHMDSVLRRLQRLQAQDSLSTSTPRARKKKGDPK